MTNPPGEYTGPEVAEAVRILKEDALLAGHRAIAERMDRMEAEVKRMPKVELTAEEKAAKWDELQKQQGQQPPAPPKAPEPPEGTPTAPPPKPPTDPRPPRKDPWFGDALS